MPNHLKLLVSVLVLSVSLAMYFYNVSIGTPGAAKWVVLFLGPFIVFAIWVFPEAQSKAIRKKCRTTQ